MYFEDRIAGDLTIVVNSVLCITSIISVAIRFQRPSSPQKGLDLQNVMLALAAICGVSMSILQCFATRYGLGLHMGEISTSNLETFLKIYPAIMVPYFLCNMFVKFGLLIFYLRTTYERAHLYAIWFMLFVAFGFGVSNVFVMIFQCVPLSKLWDQTMPGHCLNIVTFYYYNSIFMIANDVVMYIMPMVFTWNLALRRPQRIVLNLLFALGAIVVLVSILRLLSLIKFVEGGAADFSYHIASILLWSAIENHIAIFIACSPSIKALVVGTLVPLVSSVHSSISDKARTLRGSQATTNQSGLDSQSRNEDSVGDIQHELVLQAMHQPSARRASMESDDSRFDLTAPTRMFSLASSRKSSQSSLGKGSTVTVVPLDDLEAQTLPPYTYKPSQAERG